jgi:hypothetical protein
VERVAARRRAAHPQLERADAQVAERHLDLHPAMLRRRKREPVVNRGLRLDWRRGEQKQDEQKAPHQSGVTANF